MSNINQKLRKYSVWKDAKLSLCAFQKNVKSLLSYVLNKNVSAKRFTLYVQLKKYMESYHKSKKT